MHDMHIAKRRFRVLMTIGAAAVLLASWPAGAADTGKITGVVKVSSSQPEPKAIEMDADPSCVSLHSEAVFVNDFMTDGKGHLANVFVYVKEGLSARKYPEPVEKTTLDQEGCQYVPRVSAVRTGQTLVLRNSDPTLHNVHALAKVNREFNLGQPFQGMEIEKTFDQPEILVPFKCDVHSWMTAYVAVVDHPFYAVSGAEGEFSIDGLPAGDYVVEAWHETLGTQTRNVTIRAGEAVEIGFDF